jgi:hypothetical protein
MGLSVAGWHAPPHHATLGLGVDLVIWAREPETAAPLSRFSLRFAPQPWTSLLVRDRLKGDSTKKESQHHHDRPKLRSIRDTCLQDLAGGAWIMDQAITAEGRTE